jgi:hypothetical protein
MFLKYVILLPLLCSSCSYEISFSECNNNTLTALVDPQSCSTPFFVVPDLPCNYSCAAGWFLSYSPGSSSLICELCPAGTFSLGGGVSFTHWASWEHHFAAYCWIMTLYGWVLNEDCTAWHSSSEDYIVSGTASPYTWLETDLRFFTTLVKPGKLRVTYKKDSGLFSGWDIGDFYIFVDDQLAYYDYAAEKTNWQTASVSLTPGIHLVEMVFDKYITDENSEVKIREIQITGVAFADTECTYCERGASSEGASECVVCDIGSYFNGTGCLLCPEGYTSDPDSVALADCYPARLCTEADYHVYYSDCEYGNMKLAYEWNAPLLCNNSKLALPESTLVDCAVCPAGEYYEGSRCSPCASGFYIESGYLGAQCEACPSGSFAQKLREYVSWSVLPPDFQAFCTTQTNADCPSDWELRSTYLISSPLFPSHSQVGLQTSVRILHPQAYVEFNFTVFGNQTQLVFYVDGTERARQRGWDEDGFASVPLAVGKRRLKWLCVHTESENEDEACVIYRILVVGTDNGGANQCLPCAKGSVSKEPTDFCQVCDQGFEADETRTQCNACESGTYATVDHECVKCPEGLQASFDHRQCQLDGELVVENTTFLIRNLTAVDGHPPAFCSKPDMKMSCFNSFIGPVQGFGNSFYLSVLSPSTESMSSFPQLTHNLSYAFGILNRSQFSLSQPLDRPSSCGQDYNSILVNLGSEVTAASPSVSGLVLNYSNGDWCDENTRFASSIYFVCDKEEVEGWPLYMGFQDCVFQFLWPTVYACPVCRFDQLRMQNSTCRDGVKVVHVFPGKECVLEGNQSFYTVVEQCSAVEIMKTWPFMIAMFMTGVMMLLVGTTIFFACKTRGQYRRLIQYRSEEAHGK